MKKISIILILFICGLGCNAQNEKVDISLADSLNQNEPETKIIVNKEYDENGNLIKFDSSYTSFYSNIQNDSTFADSTLALFQDDFFNSFPNIQRPFLDEMFFEDSLMSYDFFKDDFFSKRFRLNRNQFDKLFEEMDSVKNKFFKDNSLQK